MTSVEYDSFRIYNHDYSTVSTGVTSRSCFNSVSNNVTTLVGVSYNKDVKLDHHYGKYHMRFVTLLQVLFNKATEKDNYTSQ